MNNIVAKEPELPNIVLKILAQNPFAQHLDSRMTMAAMTGKVYFQNWSDTSILGMCSVADRNNTDHLANALIAFIVGVVDEHVIASVAVQGPTVHEHHLLEKTLLTHHCGD